MLNSKIRGPLYFATDGQLQAALCEAQRFISLIQEEKQRRENSREISITVEFREDVAP